MSIQHQIDTIKKLIRHDNHNVCLHDERYRGGANWEICAQCGRQWADDEGGMPASEREIPEIITDAEKAIEDIEREYNLLLKRFETALQNQNPFPFKLEECEVVGGDMTANTIELKFKEPNSVSGLRISNTAYVSVVRA